MHRGAECGIRSVADAAAQAASDAPAGPDRAADATNESTADPARRAGTRADGREVRATHPGTERLIRPDGCQGLDGGVQGDFAAVFEEGLIEHDRKLGIRIYAGARRR